MQLYNKLSAKERSKLIEDAGEERVTLSFYKYANIINPKFFRDYLFINWNVLDILGRIYVAQEGINAQLSIPGNRLEEFEKQINSISFLNSVRLNVAIEQNDKSFLKLTIKVKSKIVSDGIIDKSFDLSKTGKHLNAKDFNQMLMLDNTICVDMRNHYESEIGHFKSAITPDVDTFRDSLPIIVESLSKHKEDKNIVMYCTGGIRCEKASAYLKHKGYKNVFQLEGGIIEYARQINNSGIENKFIGKNFVFDHRKGERISNEIISKCHQCGNPCDAHVNCLNQACHLLFIQCEKCADKMHKCCSSKCQDINNLPETKKKELRKGRHNSNKIFKKGRSKVLKYKV
jgi:UPF0176 protein